MHFMKRAFENTLNSGIFEMYFAQPAIIMNRFQKHLLSSRSFPFHLKKAIPKKPESD